MNAGDSSFNPPTCSPVLQRESRGRMSRSVSCTRGCISCRMPYGTESLCQNITGGVLISIHHETTVWTNVGAHAQSLLDERATPATVLTGVVGCNFDSWDSMECCIVVDPCQELPPSGITDALGKVPVLLHIGNLRRVGTWRGTVA
jgi:hypothetical protein